MFFATYTPTVMEVIEMTEEKLMETQAIEQMLKHCIDNLCAAETDLFALRDFLQFKETDDVNAMEQAIKDVDLYKANIVDLRTNLKEDLVNGTFEI